jgi:hypothetical protein
MARTSYGPLFDISTTTTALPAAAAAASPITGPPRPRLGALEGAASPTRFLAADFLAVRPAPLRVVFAEAALLTRLEVFAFVPVRFAAFFGDVFGDVFSAFLGAFLARFLVT